MRFVDVGAEHGWITAVIAKHYVGAEHMILVEQYLLAACVEYRRAHRTDGREPYLQYLFPSARFEDAAEVGYTHVIANAKRSRVVIDRIEEVVRRDYPALYRRCVAYCERAARREEGVERAS